jgi:hypothetical protein
MFIVYEKAFDNLKYGKIWKILTEENIPPQLIESIKSLYKNTEIHVRYTDKYRNQLQQTRA